MACGRISQKIPVTIRYILKFIAPHGHKLKSCISDTNTCGHGGDWREFGGGNSCSSLAEFAIELMRQNVLILRNKIAGLATQTSEKKMSQLTRSEGRCKKEEQPQIQGWSSFFLAWGNKLQEKDPTDSWEKFFDAFSVLVSAERSVTQYETDPAQLACFFRDFEEIYSQFYSSGAAVSVWDLARLGYDEVRVCSVLAWLLDRHASHGQGDVFLRNFLDCLRRENRFLVPLETCVARGYRTSVESSYDIHLDGQHEQPNSRVDIEISGPDILLFIEAKIYAPETNNQLTRYIEILRATSGTRKRALVFITPTGRLPKCEFVSAQDEVVAVSWKKIANQFSRCINSVMDRNSLAHTLIRQYCDHITQF